MAKYTKKELAELAQLNESDVGDLVRKAARKFWAWKKLAAVYEQAMLKAREAFAKEHEQAPETLKAEYDELTKQIVGWLMVHRPAANKPQHIDFNFGRIGVRQNPVAVKKSKSVTDEMVLISMEQLATTQRRAKALERDDQRLAAVKGSIFFSAIVDELNRRQEAERNLGGTGDTVDDAHILAAFDELPDFERYLRREVTLNKEALRDDQLHVAFVVQRVGIDFVTDETFYVEPKAEADVHEV